MNGQNRKSTKYRPNDSQGNNGRFTAEKQPFPLLKTTGVEIQNSGPLIFRGGSVGQFDMKNLAVGAILAKACSDFCKIVPKYV